MSDGSESIPRVDKDDTQDIEIIPPPSAKFIPQEVEPPAFVHEKIGRQEGMTYVYVDQKGALALTGPVLLLVAGFVGAVLLSLFTAWLEYPGVLAYVPPVIVAYVSYNFLVSWYKWRHTWYMVTVNVVSRKMHLRKASQVAMAVRLFVGDTEFRETAFTDLKSKSFDQGMVEEWFDLVSYKSDTAAQQADEWLKDLKMLKNGKYFLRLMTWAGQQ